MLRLLQTASFRLALAYAAVTGVTLVVLFWLTYWIATEALNRQIKSGVEAEMASLLTDWKPGAPESFARELNNMMQNQSGAPVYFFYADEKGSKLAGNLNDIAALPGWRQSDFVTARTIGVDGSADSDDDHQLVAFGKILADGSFLLVGDDSFRVLSAQEAIVLAFGWSSGVAMFLSILLGLVVGHRFLARIDKISATSRAIADGQLKERIPVQGTSDEIDRLAVNLNSMLDSNQSLLESLKQVSTSVAHDLRTPLARLLQNLEEARAAAISDPVNARGIIDRAIGETENILSTFAALLRIAQIESGSRRAGFRPVRPAALFERIVEIYLPVAEDTGKHLESSIESNFDFSGDEELLTQMIANVIENAIKHTPAGSTISIGLVDTKDGATAEISDNGAGIPQEERRSVFERFYRLDRSRTTAGSGLGLSLAAAIADLHGLTIALSDNEPGLRVVICFPAVIGRASDPSGAEIEPTLKVQSLS